MANFWHNPTLLNYVGYILTSTLLGKIITAIYVNKSIGILFRSRYYLSSKTKLTLLYYSLIYPYYITYGKTLARRSQHANSTYGNTVGRNMLGAFSHLVATCCDMLGVVGANLTSFKIEPTRPNTVATHRNTVAKRTQHVAPNNVAICCVDMLRSLGLDLTLYGRPHT